MIIVIRTGVVLHVDTETETAAEIFKGISKELATN